MWLGDVYHLCGLWFGMSWDQEIEQRSNWRFPLKCGSPHHPWLGIFHSNRYQLLGTHVFSLKPYEKWGFPMGVPLFIASCLISWQIPESNSWMMTGGSPMTSWNPPELWKVPEIVPLNHLFKWDFPWNKPSILGIPHDDLGNPHSQAIPAEAVLIVLGWIAPEPAKAALLLTLLATWGSGWWESPSVQLVHTLTYNP